jgi:RNA polymerase sigma-70 factor (ECF subfamily)
MTTGPQAAYLADGFEQHRRHLLRVAYATLGSLAEAEDVVQETWLRLQRQEDPSAIRDLRAWLTRTASRLALDALGSARARRERYVGTWLPEPLVEPVATDPAELAAIDESISLALLIVLERLSPAERASFVLHDVFDLTFEEVAGVIETTPAAARQLASRARRHVAEGRPRFPADSDKQQEVLAAFASACSEGDLEGLVSLLHPDAVWRADGGGRVKAAQIVHGGAERVARNLIALARRPPQAAAPVYVNGALGLMIRDSDGIVSVVSLTIDAGLITAIDIVRNPEKLSRVPRL